MAVKVADPAVVHKTDRALVRVGLTTADAVRAAVQSFAHELRVDDVPVLVQPVRTGTEVALGLVRESRFGPLVMVGAGGIATEVWNDRTFLMPPVDRRDAARALRSLRIWPLLQGYRGAPGADTAALEDTVTALGAIAQELPEVSEIDLNPVVANADGASLVDVKVHLRPVPDAALDLPRQLRPRGL